MKMKIAALALLASMTAAHAQTPGFYVLKDAGNPQNTLEMLIYSNSSGKSTPASISTDIFGNPISGPTGTSNINGTALYVQGVTGGVPLSTIFASPQHVICDSGCGGGGGGGGLSVAYGGAIGANGTPGGYKDASGNFQPNLGDTTAGQWVNIKGGSIANTSFGATQSGTWNVGITGTPTVTIGNASLAVTGTFFQATQPISAASLPLPTGAALETGNLATIATNTGRIPTQGQALAGASMPVVLPAAQITALTPPTSVGISGTLPGYAATPTFNLGTLNGAATAANQTASLGSVGAGAVASNSTLVGAQYNSSPITLTNTQQAALQVDASGFLKVNVSAGAASGGTSSTFGASFPGSGTAAGMSQGGLMVALTGTSGNLNVQCANCSGSGVSTADSATFTAGTSLFAGSGGVFNDGLTALTSGTQAMERLTSARGIHTNLRNSTGTEIGTASTPLQVSLANTGANGTALLFTGSITNASFGATQAVAANLNATVVGTGTFAVQAAQSGTWNIGSITTLPSLVAGSAIIGKVGIDQTTPGTTNLVAANQNGTWNITNISGTISLPTGASTSALQPTNAAQGSTTSGQTGLLMQAAVLTAAPTYTTAQTSPLNMTTGGALRVADASVVTALGSPFQAGGSIGNTSFAVTQGTASALNATVVGTGTFAVQATLQASSATAIGTVNPTTAANWGIGTSTQNSAIIANGGLILGQFNTTPTTITSGNMSPIQMDSAGNLLVNIKAGSASGAVAQGSTTSGQTGSLIQCASTTSAPTYTTATTNPFSCDTAGNLRILVSNTNANLATNADSIAAVSASSAGAGSPVNSANYVFNGTSFDRMRSGTQTGSVLTNGATNQTPTDCSSSTSTSNTAQNAFAAQTNLHGFTIVNLSTTEVMWISFTGTASAGSAGSYPLPPGATSTYAGAGSFTSPLGFGTNRALSWVAATSNHLESCTWW